eukprot:COSAG02_NODE_3762_length_6271_cov_49.947181_3_plen_51_part_00
MVCQSTSRMDSYHREYRITVWNTVLDRTRMRRALYSRITRGLLIVVCIML